MAINLSALNIKIPNSETLHNLKNIPNWDKSYKINTLFILYCHGNSNFHTLSFLFESHIDCVPYWWSSGEAKILGATFLPASWGRRLGGHRGVTVTEIGKGGN